MSARSCWKKLGRALWAGLAMLTSCGTTTTERLKLPELQTVQHVDLQRYLGVWYDVASFPQKFQRGCTGTSATYRLRDDGDIDVLNVCYKYRLDGERAEARGIARVVEPRTNSKLEVSFFRPFWGDYWIIDLAQDYSYAVVGHPSRDYLWILSRTPVMPEQTLQSIIERLRNQGYDVQRLQRTIQPQAAGG